MKTAYAAVYQTNPFGVIVKSRFARLSKLILNFNFYPVCQFFPEARQCSATTCLILECIAQWTVQEMTLI